MSRKLLFVLLLATGVVLAGDSPEAGKAAGTTEAKAKTEAAKEQAEAVRTKTEEKQGEAEEAKGQVEETPEKSEEAKARTAGGDKLISGMSILGNQEAPKSLVIVPWKGSQLGASIGISTLLDDSRRPVDKEVFMRELRYYEIRSETKP